MAKNPISRQAPSMAAATRQRSSRPPWRAGATSISGTFVMDQSVEKTEPPSTMSVWPLMKALSSDARKTTALDVVGKRVALERAGLHDGGRLEGRDVGIRLHRVAQDQPGRHRVDGDSARAKLASQRARHRDHGPLRRHVVKEQGGALGHDG